MECVRLRENSQVITIWASCSVWELKLSFVSLKSGTFGQVIVASQNMIWTAKWWCSLSKGGKGHKAALDVKVTFSTKAFCLFSGFQAWNSQICNSRQNRHHWDRRGKWPTQSFCKCGAADSICIRFTFHGIYGYCLLIVCNLQVTRNALSSPHAKLSNELSFHFTLAQVERPTPIIY